MKGAETLCPELKHCVPSRNTVSRAETLCPEKQQLFKKYRPFGKYGGRTCE